MLNSETAQLLRELKRGAVRVIDEKDVIARLEQANEDGADRRHSRAERLARFAVLERRKLFFQDFDRGVLASRVNRMPVFRGSGRNQ